MSLQNFAGAALQTLSNFGLGTSWNLSECKYVAPVGAADDGASEDDRTITFLDTGFLSTLNLSAIPTLDLAQAALSDYLYKSTADSSGKTKIISESLSIQNNVIKYQLPGGSEVIRTWGTRATSFKIITLICGSNYINKVKQLSEFVSYISDMEGGVLHHPLLGTFENTHILSMEVSEGADVFNGSFVALEFATSNTYKLPVALEEEDPWWKTLLKYISTALAVAQAVMTLVNIVVQIKVLLGPFLAVLGIDFDSAKPALNKDGSITLKSEDGAKTIKVNTAEVNPVVGTALKSMHNNNIPLDYDLIREVNSILEKLLQHANEIILGFGTGYETTTTINIYVTLDITTVVYETSYTLADGRIITETEEIIEFSEGKYTIRKVTTTQTPVFKGANLNSVKSQIDDLIVYLGIISSLNYEVYSPCADLISTLEDLFNYIKRNFGRIKKLPNETSVLALCNTVGTDVDVFLSNNPELIGLRPLRKDMEVFI